MSSKEEPLNLCSSSSEESDPNLSDASLFDYERCASLEKKEAPTSPRQNEQVFAIDLGTTFSSVARGVKSPDEILMVEGTSNITHFPSIIYYRDNPKSANLYDILVADNAEDCLLSQNLIMHSKRFIGLRFKEILSLTHKYDFEIREGPYGMVQFKIDLDCGKVIIINPTDVATLILLYLKEQIHNSYTKNFFSAEINCVITVPGYFTSMRKEQTLRAAKNAGFNKTYVCVEPVAAIMHHISKNIPRYSEDMKDGGTGSTKNICVLDQGGGTTDIALIELLHCKDVESPWHVKVLKTDGLLFLGGVDYTFKIHEYVLREVKANAGDDWDKLPDEEKQEISSNLYRDVEDKKHKLNSRNAICVKFRVKILRESYLVEFTPSKYKEICTDYINLFKATVLKCIHKEKIDEVYTIGGSSTVFFIDETVKEIFNDIPDVRIIVSQQKRDAVARGAAVIGKLRRGYKMSGHIVSFVSSMGFAIRVEVIDTESADPDALKHTVMIERDAAVPASRLKTFWNNGHYSCRIKFFEGNEEFQTSQNVFLTAATLQFKKRRKKDRFAIKVRLEITVDGIFKGACWMDRHPNSSRRDLQSFVGIKDLHHMSKTKNGKKETEIKQETEIKKEDKNSKKRKLENDQSNIDKKRRKFGNDESE